MRITMYFLQSQCPDDPWLGEKAHITIWTPDTVLCWRTACKELAYALRNRDK